MTRSLIMDALDERNRLDQMAQGVIGKPLDRPEGKAKVSGTAPYAAEYQIAGQAHGVLVTATVAKGEVIAIDKDSVQGMPGVIAVMSDQRMVARPAQGGAGKAPVQQVRQVAYFGQPVALVVAETFEQARDAAKALRIEYRADDLSDVVLDPQSRDAPVEEQAKKGARKGDLDHAMAEAAFTVDSTYTTEGHASAAMEPHAAIAEWDGEQLTVHASLQMLNTNIYELADALGLEEEHVRLVSRYIGGGFGSKLGIGAEVVAASVAAITLGRPVRVEMSRQQVFQCVERRSETHQRLRLAANRGGCLIGFGHEARVSNLPGEKFSEPVTQASHFLYGGENRLIRLELARIHRMMAGSVRAPGEAVGMQTLEAAMDELAEAAGIDPVELRLRNIPERHPTRDVPYSSRKLAECLTRGAEAFGWDSGPRKPCQRREGEWWIGTGMASAARINFLSKAEARVSLQPDGTALVQTDMTDIGTGTYAVLCQVAAEMLGLDPTDVLVELGDTVFPRGSGSGGSVGAASTGSAVFLACEALRSELATRMGGDEQDLTLKDGIATLGNRRLPLAELLQGDALERTGQVKPGKTAKDYAQATFGAFFAQIGVNAFTGETRVQRMLGVFGIGRVLNEKTARSQCEGGMVWGIGAALSEELLFDLRDGHLVNCDLAEYHVPVNRDVPDLEVFFVEERDPAASPIQAKGAGELGISGAAAAIANAIYNACGVRLYELPMTPDRMIAKLPQP